MCFISLAAQKEEFCSCIGQATEARETRVSSEILIIQFVRNSPEPALERIHSSSLLTDRINKWMINAQAALQTTLPESTCKPFSLLILPQSPLFVMLHSRSNMVADSLSFFQRTSFAICSNQWLLWPREYGRCNSEFQSQALKTLASSIFYLLEYSLGETQAAM